MAAITTARPRPARVRSKLLMMVRSRRCWCFRRATGLFGSAPHLTSPAGTHSVLKISFMLYSEIRGKRHSATLHSVAFENFR